VVKISNPTARQQRSEKKSEKKSDGRTIFVGQLPFKATADEVKQLFAPYGTLEKTKLPPDAKFPSRNRGIAFLTFATPEQAQAALAMNEQDFMKRKITVHIVSEEGRRTTKSVGGRSRSPSVQLNGEVDSASSVKSEQDLSVVEERRQRTVVICDVPDIVNESQIKSIAEKIGTVLHVILKTNHQGALIEFDNVPDAGRAMIELDGYEITPGRRIRVTTEKDMYQQKAEHKAEQFVKRPPPSRPTNASANGPVKRPAQPGVRKGGHLGQRSAQRFQSDAQNGAAADGKKTNDDFRSLINKG